VVAFAATTFVAGYDAGAARAPSDAPSASGRYLAWFFGVPPVLVGRTPSRGPVDAGIGYP